MLQMKPKLFNTNKIYLWGSGLDSLVRKKNTREKMTIFYSSQFLNRGIVLGKFCNCMDKMIGQQYKLS